MTRLIVPAACVLVLGGATLVLAQDPTAGSQASPAPGIAGIWKLNTDLSDTGERLAEGGRPAGGGPGGGMPPGGGGGRGGMGGGMPGGMGGFGSGQPDRAESQRLRRIVQEALEPPKALTIVPDGPRISLTAGDGRAFSYVTDGKKQDQITGDGELEHRTTWNGAQLVIETKIQDGPKVTRTYAPSGDTQLIVIVRLEGGQASRAVVAHHIYDRKD
jgi:hypothetical protein